MNASHHLEESPEAGQRTLLTVGWSLTLFSIPRSLRSAATERKVTSDLFHSPGFCQSPAWPLRRALWGQGCSLHESNPSSYKYISGYFLSLLTDTPQKWLFKPWETDHRLKKYLELRNSSHGWLWLRSRGFIKLRRMQLVSVDKSLYITP